MSPLLYNVGPTLSPVAMANVSQTATNVTVLTTAMTTQTKSTVELITLHAPPLHSPVQTSVVFPHHGAVMDTMTALTTVMKTTAPPDFLGPALAVSLHVPTIAAFLIPGAVTLIMIVETVQMKLTAM